MQFQGTNEDRAKPILSFGVHMKDRNFYPLNCGKSLRGFKENSSSFNHSCVCEGAKVLQCEAAFWDGFGDFDTPPNPFLPKRLKTKKILGCSLA